MSAAFGVEFSKDDNYLKNAVKSLLGKSENEITEITDKIINEQLRFAIASFSAEDIFRDLKKFQTQIRCDIDQSLGKIGLVTNKADFIDITDDAQYCLKEAQKTIEGLTRLEKAAPITEKSGSSEISAGG